MSDEAKIRHADETIAIVVREKKGSVKISELDSNNRDVDRDSSDESDIDESLDSLRPFEILSMHS